jgi:hypothetical protein
VTVVNCSIDAQDGPNSQSCQSFKMSAQWSGEILKSKNICNFLVEKLKKYFSEEQKLDVFI